MAANRTHSRQRPARGLCDNEPWALHTSLAQLSGRGHVRHPTDGRDWVAYNPDSPLEFWYA